MHTLQNTLVEQYVPLAKKLAYQKKRVLPRFVDADELVSAAYMGLVEAASRFDPGMNVNFSTYAYPRISGAIHDYLRECGWGKRDHPVSVESLDSHTDEGPVHEVESYEEPAHNEMLEVISKGLGDQAEDIMRLYFVEQYTMKEVGDRIGVTEGRVSQIIKDYKDHIRNRYDREELCELLAA